MMFFSSRGLSADGIDSSFSEAETAQKKLKLCHSRARYFLCDSSKLGKSFLFSVCHVTYVNRIISDADVDAWLEKHKEAESRPTVPYLPITPVCGE